LSSYQVLNYDLVDDLCLFSGDINAISEKLLPMRAERLGPMLELLHIKPKEAEVLIRSKAIDAYRFSSIVPKIFGDEMFFRHLNGSRSLGLSSVRMLSEGPNWTKFAIDVKAATLASGFSAAAGSEIVAAVGEFFSNVMEHSESSETGYVAYSGEEGIFEFVVADSGIGVLQSLKSNPAFANLADSGRAIELAITEGISSSVEAGRGHGFRPVFVGLANISDELRFRSGDHGHMVQRAGTVGIDARTIQLANLKGFFCSVVCSLQARIF
jgi:anti-sigma regulatory factor (Ser/Thr protein kinase)